jgi:hypothetical protein
MNHNLKKNNTHHVDEIESEQTNTPWPVESNNTTTKEHEQYQHMDEHFNALLQIGHMIYTDTNIHNRTHAQNESRLEHVQEPKEILLAQTTCDHDVHKSEIETTSKSAKQNNIQGQNSTHNVNNASNNEKHIIQLRINGITTQAIIDTGANRSAITPGAVTKMELITKEVTGTLSTAMGKTPRVGQTIATIDFLDENNMITCTLTEELELINLPSTFRHKGKPVELCIGRDIQQKLGIKLTGIPTSTTNHVHQIPHPYPDLEGEPDMKSHYKYKDYIQGATAAEITETQRTELLLTLKKSIDRNQQLQKFPLCKAQGSTVHIQTKPNSFAYTRQYPVARVYQKLITETITNWLEQGIIEQTGSQTAYNSALLPVPKVKGAPLLTADDIRLCNDFRKLNSTTETGDHFTVPKIRDIMDNIPGAKFISIIDIRWAFQSMNLAPEDRHKTSFTWENRQYQHTRAPYGLTNVTSSFQRMISNVLRNCEKFANPYIDDIIVHTHTNSPIDHAEHIKTVIDRLTTANLQFNVKKSKMFLSEINILGHRVSRHGLMIDPTKLGALEKLTAPTSGKQVSSFLGICNYWRDWIPAYATIAAPLEKLRKQQKIQLNADELKAFQHLKSALLNNHILEHPNFEKPFELGMDASNVGISAILFQRDEQNQPKIIRFAARALTLTEKNYSATKKELLALVYTLKNFRSYIYGYRFIAWTDHRALTFMLTQRKTNALIDQWYETLSEFDFEIKHIQGVQNILPDALSRLFPERENSAHAKELENQLGKYPMDQMAKRDNDNNNGNNQESIDYNSETYHDNITDISRDTNKPQNLEVMTLRIPVINLTNTEDMEQITDPTEQQRLVKEAHDMAHFATKNMTSRILRNNKFWPTMTKDCKVFYENCTQCQRNNILKQGFHPLQSITAELPMDHVAFDLAGPFAETSQGHKYAFVMVDVFTRFCFIKAIKNKEAATIARTLLKFFMDFGFPKIWQSDNAPEFTSEIMKELASQMQIQARTVTPYHPRANGLAEAHVKTITNAIRKKVNAAIRDWKPTLQFIQYAINTKTTAIHGSAPFSLMFARKDNQFEDHRNDQRNENLSTSTDDHENDEKSSRNDDSNTTVTNKFFDEKLLTRLQHMQDTVFPAISEKVAGHNHKTQEYFQQKHKGNIIQDIPIGTLVMTTNPVVGSKLQPKLEGPFIVSRRTQGGSYILTIKDGTVLERNYAPSQLKILSTTSMLNLHQTNHEHLDVNKIKPNNRNLPESQQEQEDAHSSKSSTNNTSDEEQDPKDYNFQKILDHRESKTNPGAKEYLVKWTGYTNAHNTWEPETNFNDHTTIIKYWKEQTPIAMIVTNKTNHVDDRFETEQDGMNTILDTIHKTKTVTHVHTADTSLKRQRKENPKYIQ